eukprot:TRINITY_DN10188_c0_g1_i1.p1 TRINITY_DN10188_c0_g1~~TRINITY_DN10188_c0_g1_i1.p1  ORF type:complete len:464 (+),score=113.67 TRINITY_DN10188_c0_g1_i1:53-1444(+)
MAGAAMKVDVVPRLHFLIIGIISIAILLISIIVGATGPKEYASQTYSAYNCPDGSHIWNDVTCTGIQMSTNNTYWAQDAPSLEALNRFWSLVITPFTSSDITSVDGVMAEIDLVIEVYSKDDPDADWKLMVNQTVGMQTVCDAGQVQCSTVLLVDEEDLKFDFYHVRVSAVDGGPSTSSGEPFLNDVVFTFYYDTDGYSSLELGWRISMLAITAGVILAFLWAMRNTSFDEWSWEQKAILWLLFALLGYNNPFFGMTFVVPGWGFQLLDAFFNILFLSVFLMFALLAIDKIRLEDTTVVFDLRSGIKLIVIGTFFLIGFVLFAWVDISDDFDPIIGQPGSVTGQSTLFYIEAILYTSVIVWLSVIIIMTVTVVSSQTHYLYTRFCFISIPTSIVVVSILIGLFTGNFGPYNTSTLPMVYYSTLYNVYVWVLAFGFWPVKERFTLKNPSEADSIVQFDRVNADL